MLKSSICKQEDIESENFKSWSRLWGWNEPLFYHRKNWEWSFICQALYERDKLGRDLKGCGFAVGKEPLSSVFTSMNSFITASDAPSENTQSKNWLETNQFSNRKDDVYFDGICEKSIFDSRVLFEEIDMNNIPIKDNEFDFIWSSCSIEHLGSLRNGIDFVLNSLSYLKPGGVAVHTTEFNVSSNDGTLDSDSVVLYRKKDIENLALILKNHNCKVELDFSLGKKERDFEVSLPPFLEPHLRLNLNGYEATSFGLIIEKL